MPKDDWTPYPWPAKAAILGLLHLPRTATQDQYLAAWEKAVKPLRTETPSEAVRRAINTIMTELKVGYDKAWEVAQTRYPALFNYGKEIGVPEATIGAAAENDLRPTLADKALNAAVQRGALTKAEAATRRPKLLSAANDQAFDDALRTIWEMDAPKSKK